MLALYSLHSIVALASSGADQFGVAQHHIELVSPLLLDISSPRSVTVGDTALIKVSVQNTSEVPELHVPLSYTDVAGFPIIEAWYSH